MNTLLQRFARSIACICLPLALSCVPASADPIRVHAGFTANTLAANDDDSTGPVQLPFEICFFGQRFTELYVNNNGNVTFGGPLDVFTPFFPTGGGIPIIAPFFADVDTRIGREVTYGSATLADGRQAFAVNYIDVGYYEEHQDKLNSFQLVLIDRGNGDFDIEFNYRTINWETGDASDGVNGFGGDSAIAGFSNGAGTSFTVAGSGVDGSLLDTSATGLIYRTDNPDGIEGRVTFECRDCFVAIPEPGTLPLVGIALGAVALVHRRRARVH